jgi:hypothetical protein
MASEIQQNGKKILDITVQASHLTSDVLKSAMQDFLSGKAEKTGRMSLKQLSSKSSAGKLESIEITDSNIKDFLSTAKKYEIDYALKRDSGTSPTTYHVFFQASKTDAFKKAFSEYASKKQADISAPKRGEISRDQLKAHAQQISRQPKKERVRERSKEVSH